MLCLCIFQVSNFNSQIWYSGFQISYLTFFFFFPQEAVCSLVLDVINFIFTNLWNNFKSAIRTYLYFSLLKLKMVYLETSSDLSNQWYFSFGDVLSFITTSRYLYLRIFTCFYIIKYFLCEMENRIWISGLIINLLMYRYLYNASHVVAIITKGNIYWMLTVCQELY